VTPQNWRLWRCKKGSWPKECGQPRETGKDQKRDFHNNHWSRTQPLDTLILLSENSPLTLTTYILSQNKIQSSSIKIKIRSCFSSTKKFLVVFHLTQSKSKTLPNSLRPYAICPSISSMSDSSSYTYVPATKAPCSS
jgi:hypothetical protein